MYKSDIALHVPGVLGDVQKRYRFAATMYKSDIAFHVKVVTNARSGGVITRKPVLSWKAYDTIFRA